MFPKNQHHYVPVLKWKRGEQLALQQSIATVKARMTPLLEMVSIPTDRDTEEQTKTLEDHVDPAIDKMVSAWGTTDPFFIDPGDVAADMSASKQDGATYVFGEAQKKNLKFVPVTGINRSTTEQNAAKNFSAQRGLCIRIDADELEPTTVGTTLTTFLRTHALTGGDVDIVVDLGTAHGQKAFIVEAAMTSAIACIPSVGSFRTFTIVASAFPASMGAVGAQSSAKFDRIEWIAWFLLHAKRSTLARLPTFGDYGIQHPTGVEGFDPRFMYPSAAIRYTLDKEWLILKGLSTKDHPAPAQFRRLAQLLLKDPSFYGTQHCPGCADVDACAKGGPGLGSPEVWRRIGTKHHMAVVTDQIVAAAYP